MAATGGRAISWDTVGFAEILLIPPGHCGGCDRWYPFRVRPPNPPIKLHPSKHTFDCSHSARIGMLGDLSLKDVALPPPMLLVALKSLGKEHQSKSFGLPYVSRQAAPRIQACAGKSALVDMHTIGRRAKRFAFVRDACHLKSPGSGPLDRRLGVLGISYHPPMDRRSN